MSCMGVKHFCNERELTVNASKTQFIMFKSPATKIPAEIVIELDNCPVKAETSVKLLEVILDQHLTMSPHIEKIVKKCKGLRGMLARASTVPCHGELLKLAYIALIRTHLEYASLILMMASNTNLNKLEIVQKSQHVWSPLPLGSRTRHHCWKCWNYCRVPPIEL